MRGIQIVILFLCLNCQAQLSLRNPAYVAAVLATASGGSAPATPGSFVISSVGATGVTLGWGNVSGEDAFRVQFSEPDNMIDWTDADAGCGSDANPTAANVLSYFYDVACEPNSGSQVGLCFLKFRVRAENAFGNSGWSTELQVPPSIMVTDLSATYTAMSGCHLTFTDTGETGGNCVQQCWRSINNASYVNIGNATPGDGFYDDNDSVALDAAFALMQEVKYKMIYHNDGGDGPASNIATAAP